MNMHRDRFYMVYGEGQRAPTYKHQSRDGAETEAERLAAQHPGIEFIVLESVVGVRRPRRPPPIEWFEYVDLPF